MLRNEYNGISNVHLNLYTNYKYNSRQYIFEKKYVYCNYLYDSSIYLFNRCRPLYLPISILQHILDIYNDYCKNESWLNESRMLFLLKANYNLSLLYYTVGNNKEAINDLNKAKEILCKIKNFPVSKILKSMDINDLQPENMSAVFKQFVVLKLSGNCIDTKLEHPWNIPCIFATLTVLNILLLNSIVVKETQF